MGTRHLTAVYMNGMHKVAQYGQWDGHLDGQGQTVLDFLNGGNEQVLRSALQRTRWLSDQEAEACDRRLRETGKSIAQLYPLLTRDAGAGILNLIVASTDSEILLQDTLSFALDALFCEYVYVIDLDKRVLEVYCGSTGQPPQAGTRFYGVKAEEGEGKAPRLVEPIPLDSLPKDFEALTARLEAEYELEEQED